MIVFLVVLVACSKQTEETITDETNNATQVIEEQPTTETTNNETKETEEIVIKETALSIPKLEVKSFPIPDGEQFDFTKQMHLGFNLGNTFDAIAGDGFSEQGNTLDIESSWVGIKTNVDMIKAIKEAGFNTLRIPVSWHNHVDEKYTINDAWLNRVQEVVNYAYDLDMNVILNIHHDNNKNFLYPSYELQDQSKRYVETIWKQLSEKFKDYDHRLIFEAMNEPRLVGTAQEWWIDVNSPTSTEPLDVINLLNQSFVDVVRKSGGNNATRYLMVPSYAASPDFTQTDKFKLPTDSTPNKLILSVHSYSPYFFALADPTDKNSITSFNIEKSYSTKDIDAFMNNVYEKYIQNGIPVVIGEFGSRNKDGNTQDRIDHAAYYANAAASRGIPVVWWDNHHFEGQGEQFGLLDRFTTTWKYPEIIEALKTYAIK